MNNGFTFTYKHPTNVARVTVEVDEDADLEQLEYAFCDFLKACGYSVCGVTIIPPVKAIG